MVSAALAQASSTVLDSYHLSVGSSTQAISEFLRGLEGRSNTILTTMVNRGWDYKAQVIGLIKSHFGRDSFQAEATKMADQYKAQKGKPAPTVATLVATTAQTTTIIWHATNAVPTSSNTFRTGRKLLGEIHASASQLKTILTTGEWSEVTSMLEHLGDKSILEIAAGIDTVARWVSEPLTWASLELCLPMANRTSKSARINGILNRRGLHRVSNTWGMFFSGLYKILVWAQRNGEPDMCQEIAKVLGRKNCVTNA